MEDPSDFKVEENPNLEEIEQFKETIVEVIDSKNDVEDDSIKEEAVDLEKPPEILDVSESGGDPVVPDISLNEQIEESETSIENSVIAETKPDDNINVESESLVETDIVNEEIQESSAASSYENDSAAGIDAEAKELASLTSDVNETPVIEQNVESEETERLSVNGNEASLTATDMSETGLEVSELVHTNDNGEIPPAEADLGAKGTEETKLQATRAIAPAVDSSNDDGNTAKTADIAENKPDAVLFERKPCWASMLGCCGLSEAFHLSGR